jgi:hypothetical protein
MMAQRQTRSDKGNRSVAYPVPYRVRSSRGSAIAPALPTKLIVIGLRQLSSRKSSRKYPSSFRCVTSDPDE